MLHLFPTLKYLQRVFNAVYQGKDWIVPTDWKSFSFWVFVFCGDPSLIYVQKGVGGGEGRGGGKGKGF